MLRRLFLALALALAAPAVAQERTEPPLNVVWLTVEDMSPWVPCYGDDTVPTPNLDRLAAASVRYTNAFATSPVCAPARSSLITGMYATRMGTMHMRTGKPSRAALDRDPGAYDDIPSYEGVPPAFVRCFPEHLRARGYYCTNNAKTDYQFRAPATTWDASGKRAHYRDESGAAIEPFFAVFNHGGTHESQAFPDASRRPEAVAPGEVPVPPLYPDTPAVRDALARTYNNIAAMDAWLGKKLDELLHANVLDRTVIFFFSDHGVGLPRGKRSPYDLGTRVPLLVRFPDGEGGGTVDDRVVSFVDFGPTVLSLVGIKSDERLDGVPFLGQHAREGKGFAFAHADRFDSVYDRSRSVSDGRYRYVRNYLTDVPHLLPNAYREELPMMADFAQATAPEHWQTTSTKRPAEELYDSLEDPWEVRNLAHSEEHAEPLERLSEAVDAWIESTGDLGLVLPEKRMVEEHLWPGGARPQTATPRVQVIDDRIVIECETEGASIGWRLDRESPWRVYAGLGRHRGSATLEVLAHRIGYAPATTTFELR